MQALSVIEPIDIVLDGDLCLGLILKLSVPRQLVLQWRELGSLLDVGLYVAPRG